MVVPHRFGAPEVGIFPAWIGRFLVSSILVAAISATGLQAGGAPPYVVENDRGGFLVDRLREIRNLRASGQPVEIRGRVCLSTCTLFLGLPQTCIHPSTSFGFHGPSRMGRKMTAERFDYYSRVIAQYYPEPLQSWYLRKGRKKIRGMHRIPGERIVAMGVPACG